MKTTKLFLFLIASFLHVSVKAWDVDMSRRKGDLQKFRGPASVADEKKDQKWLEGLFHAPEAAQEFVILNTEKGFVPETLTLKRGKSYKIHVVNVNEKQKNTSFVLDAFSEHHGTYFGQTKTFEIAPRTDGIFSFICPETAKQGRLIVYPDGEGSRLPASK